jgi:hypothetical protein
MCYHLIAHAQSQKRYCPYDKRKVLLPSFMLCNSLSYSPQQPLSGARFTLPLLFCLFHVIVYLIFSNFLLNVPNP